MDDERRKELQILSQLLGKEQEIRPEHRFDEVKKIYADHWTEWLNSSGCFLTEDEKIIVDNYRATGTHKTLDDRITLSASRISAIFNTAVRRLINNQHLYQHWIANQLFDTIGLTETDPVLHLLRKPMHEHGFSKPLYMFLSMEAESLEELLEIYTASDLLNLHGFGEKKMAELRAYLEKNRAIDHLK